jgi:DNA-binding winged helix-turn-helix (wHTH) protein/Tol biopolymer transport system component
MPSYCFGPFSLDPETRVLRRDGEPVPITGKALDTLLLLLHNRGRLVDKDELLAQLWPGMVVEEANLSQSIFTVRKILGDNPKDHRYIATVAGRGYQFVATVTELADSRRFRTGSVQEELPATEASSAGTTVVIGRRHKLAAISAICAMVVLFSLLWFSSVRHPKPSTELTQRRLTFNSSTNTVESAAISADGNYLAFSDAAGIHVKLLSTGEEQLIQTASGVANGNPSYVRCWFRDGTRLLAHSKRADGHQSMWTVSVMGQSRQGLRDDALPWDVSPDGQRVVFSPTGTFDEVHEIWTIGSHGENPEKVLAVAANEWLWSVKWSPDGQRLAYIRTQRLANKFLQFIESCDLKGANRTLAMAVGDSDLWVEDIAWLPDGRIMYSRMESSDSSDDNLWEIMVENQSGAVIGKAKRITQWAGTGLQGLSVTANGKQAAVRKTSSQVQTYLGQLTAGGTHMTSPRRLTTDEANNDPSAWTADSKAVIFISDRNGRSDIFKQDISKDTAEPLVTGPGSSVLPRLSADGSSVLYLETVAAPATGLFPRYRLMRVPVNGGVPQFVLGVQNYQDFQCANPPASRCVIIEESQDQKRLLLTEFDAVKGRGKVLRTIDKYPHAHDFAYGLSPDGETFAVASLREPEMHVRLLSLSGGADREVSIKGWFSISNLDWSANGKGLYCGSRSPQGGTLLYVDQGRAHALWQSNEIGTYELGAIPSPDGRYLAIFGTVSNSNVWMISGF